MSSLFRKGATKKRKRPLLPVSEESNGQSDTGSIPASSSSSSSPTTSGRARTSTNSLTTTFADLGLCPPLVSTCRKLGFTRPTAVQQAIIPLILNPSATTSSAASSSSSNPQNHHHILTLSATGSGKTAAFALPLLHLLSSDPYGIYALVLTPTRELAKQIQQQIMALGNGSGFKITCALIIGGEDVTRQNLELSHQPNFVVATPGRCAELCREEVGGGGGGWYKPNFRKVKFVVLDEADRLLCARSGFERDVAECLLQSTTVMKRDNDGDGKKRVRRNRCRTLLFSATMTRSLASLEEMAGAGAGRLPLRKVVVRADGSWDDGEVSDKRAKKKKKKKSEEEGNHEAEQEKDSECNTKGNNECDGSDGESSEDEGSTPNIPAGLRQEYIFMPSRVREAYLLCAIRTLMTHGGRGKFKDNNSRSGSGWNATNSKNVDLSEVFGDANNDDDDDDDDDALPRRRPPRRAARPPAGNASVDVSDDDDVTFLPGPVPVFKKGKVGGGESPIGNLSSKRKKADDHLGSYDDSDDENEAPDDDSVDVDLLLHSSDAFSDPSTELWGSYPRHSSDESDESGDDGDNADNTRLCIPISWLRTGFKLSDCGNGLAVAADDDWDRQRRSQPQAIRDGPMKGVKGLFPHNCKGVAALLSIVTALLYSGASIQGGSTVTCDADRVPFDELTLEQRKREFDPRLVDALSALMFIAAKAGSRRCEQKLSKYDKYWARRKKGIVSAKEEKIYTSKRLKLQKRARMCHVCWWETDTANSTTIYPEGRDPKDVQFKTSFTNIHDIKSYVKTHLRSFKEPGGCALLLETILHCHGPYMNIPPTSLLKCCCNESVKHIGKMGKNKTNDASLIYEEHECMTTELLSLLLTGEVHSTYENWSADMLGIGLLRMSQNNTAPIGNRLLRPIKPIWLCVGDYGYSTLFLDMKEFIGSTNSLEEPGKTFQLAHWSCWSGVRTSFRVITSMHEKEPYNVGQESIAATISDSEQEGRSISDSICTRLCIEQKRDAAMPWKQSGIISRTAFNPDLKPITDDELQSVSFHPDDEKYYPEQFRRWRFQFGSSSSSSSSMSMETGWIPFYRLRGRQRLIVEMKLAPRICAIVRSRWPLATVRDFSPSGKFPVV
mmetsp:Transcript_3183/g.7039  ORF Transcript_3183/g.7039 Transcript_3183/m.7039 type:complete len:1121 (+) Transcript_3183:97-3459(+)